MLSKRAFRVAALAAILFAVGIASAADRGVAPRPAARDDLTVKAPHVQLAGPASAMQILRLRFLDTIRLLKALQNAESDPASFGTDGLSDGPDPIDASENGPGDTGTARKQRDDPGSSSANGEATDRDTGFGSR